MQPLAMIGVAQASRAGRFTPLFTPSCGALENPIPPASHPRPSYRNRRATACKGEPTSNLPLLALFPAALTHGAFAFHPLIFIVRSVDTVPLAVDHKEQHYFRTELQSSVARGCCATKAARCFVDGGCVCVCVRTPQRASGVRSLMRTVS